MNLDLYKKLNDLKIQINVVDGRLDIEAPEDVLSDALIEEIKNNKQELIEFIETYKREENTAVSIPKVSEQESYVLSSSQKRLWILSQFSDINNAYTISDSVQFDGSIDKKLLQKSFLQIIKRHEILRTTFNENDFGEIRQWILPFKNEGFDIGYTDAAEFENNEVERLVQNELNLPFDLKTGPLIRVHLFKTSDQKTIITLIMHHIISDGWSLTIFTNELLQIYNNLISNKESLIEPLRIQYKDYSEWEQKQLASDEMKKNRSFWLNKFSDTLPKIDVARDYPRPAIKTYNGKKITTKFDTSLLKRLQNIAIKEDATLFIVLLSSVNTFLYHYAGADDQIIGTSKAGRDNIDLENQIGFYIKNIPLRTTLNPSESFLKVVQEVKTTVIDSFNHDSYPYDKLVEELHLERDLSHNPLFDILVVLQNLPSESDKEISESGAAMQNYDKSVQSTSQFDLIFDFNETQDGFYMSVTYNTDLYKESTVKRLQTHFEYLLSQLTAQPDLAINQFSLLSSKEKQMLLDDFNTTEIIYDLTENVIRKFEEQVKKTPHGIALEFENKTITYDYLNEKSNQLANYIVSNYNLSQNDKVGIVLNRSENLIIAILAVIKSGASYVPIDPNYPEAYKEYMIENAELKALITQTDYFFDFSYFTEPIFSIDIQIDDLEDSTENPNIAVDNEDLAYLIYTSGSTGNPKGCKISHGNLYNYVNWASHYYGTQNGEANFALFTSLSFDLTVTSIFCTLLHGGRLKIYNEKETISDILKNAFSSDSVVNYLKITPAHVTLLKELGITNSNVSKIILGGEAVNEEHITILKSINPKIKIYNEYGPTETTVGCIVMEVLSNEKVLIGSPIWNTQIYILNENGHLNPIGISGEIFIAGNSVGKGYNNNEKMSNERFVSNPFIPGTIMYKTGDYGRWDENGNIEYLGRNDDQVKIRGYRIELEEIEESIKSYGKFPALVLNKKNSLGNNLIVFLINKEKGKVSELKNYLSKNLPAYMVPEIYVEVDHFPLTHNGKIDKKELLKFEEDQRKKQEYFAPTEETEIKLTQLWEKVLGKEKISIKENFFAIGGHSLNATQLVALIHKEFDVVIGIEDIFSNAVLENQAKLIKTKEKNAFSKIEQLEDRLYYPLSSSQKRLYFLQQFDTASTAYNVSVIRFLDEKTSVEKMEAILRKVIQRHQSLRTSFEEVNGTIMQKIHLNVDFKLDYYVAEKENLDQLIQDYIQPFDLSGDSLMRSAIFKLDTGGYAWIVDMHHIISDGSSQEILNSDFIKLFNNDNLPELKLQYRDFSEWQNNLFSTGKLDKQKQYWKTEFSNSIPRLNLPTDYSRPPVFSFEGANHIFTIDEYTTLKVREFSNNNGASLQMTLMTLLFVLLHKYSDQEDILIGCGINGRRHADLESIVGMFVNTIVIRSFPNADKTFIDFFKEVITKCINAYENQDLQFEDMVNMLNVEREPSRNPLFDVSIVVQNYNKIEIEKEEIQKIDSSLMPRLSKKHTTSKFDLTWFVYEFEKEIEIEIEYYTGIFKPESVARFAEHFQNILKKVVDNPNLHLSEIDLISKSDKDLILSKFVNGETKSFAFEVETFHGLFEKNAAIMGDNVAIEDNFGSLSYKEVDLKSNQIAHFLKNKLNIKPETRVGLLKSRKKEIAIDILGIMKAGGAYVPLDVNTPEERLVYMLENSNAEVLFVEKELIELANKLQWRVVNLKDIVCWDSENIYEEFGRIENQYSDKELWEHVGETATDEITAGGWMSSYTGEYLSKEEMDEYSQNIFLKLEDKLHKDMRVLEIGCSSGLSMFPIAKKVKHYVGTDISESILKLTQNRVDQEGIQNISLFCLAANEIDELDYADFDLVIINSVIQSFNGHNYLRNVLKQVISKVKPQALIFLGDLMDEDKRQDLILDMQQFDKNNTNENYRTKLEWSDELFVDRKFLSDLIFEKTHIKSVSFSEKIFSIENELTKFRYDAFLTIDKTFAGNDEVKNKYQYDFNDVSKYETTSLQTNVTSDNLAYIIYTSGSTGRPKGVMIEHRSLLDLAIWQKDYFELDGYKTVAQITSLSFDVCVGELVMALGNRCKSVIINTDDLMDLVHIINQKNIDVVLTVPSVLQQLDPTGLKRYAKIVTGGEKCHAELYDKWIKHCFLINGYGPTEYTVFAHAWNGNIDKNIVPIGKPRHNLKSYILDDNLNCSPIGVPGEIYLSGPGISRGYMNDPKRTFESFVPNKIYLENLFKDKGEIFNGVSGEAAVDKNNISLDTFSVLLQKELLNTDIALDFGCGSEELVKSIFDKGVENITGLAINAMQINNLKDRGIKSNLQVLDLPKDTFFSTGIVEMESADFVNSILTLHQVENPKNLLENMALSLKAGGRFILGTLLPLAETNTGIKLENKICPGISENDDKYYIIELMTQYNLYEIEHYRVNTKVHGKNGIEEFKLHFFCGVKKSDTGTKDYYSKMYKTGDIAKWLLNGNIDFLGRRDEQIKLRGYRVELGEIEKVLLTHQSISETVVMDRRDEFNEVELIAYIVSSKKSIDTDVRAFLNKTLPLYMVPSQFIFLDEFPLNASGKIDKPFLSKLFAVGNISIEYVAPTNEIEQKLASIYSELLGKERIGIQDNFFELGGHSLKATRLVSYIAQEFGIKIKIQDIFIHPTIEKIGKVIKAHIWLKDSEKVVLKNNIIEVN